MKKVLIVSPNFAPLNTPDMQRARLALPFLREHGWEPTILAVEPDYAGTGVRDPLLEETYPRDVRTVRVRGISPAATRWLGIGTIWWRCGRALRRAGDALLGNERFDLVFFTTTVFNTFSFGPRWLQRFGVPYVLDYQDPWINRYYARTRTPPPGGKLKYALAQWSARRREPVAVRTAAAIVAVSESYTKELSAAYDLPPTRLHVLPFGASAEDFKVAAAHPPSRPLIDFTDGNFHHVYTGRLGPDMQVALTILFRAFRRFLSTHPSEARRMRFHFVGTDYAPPPRGRAWALPVAAAEQVADYVDEHPARVPYFEALHYLQCADALAVIGSSDPTYSASKVFPYVLARRPALFIYHEKSPVLSFVQQIGGGLPIGFSVPSGIERSVDEVYAQWFVAGEYRNVCTVHEDKFRPYTAAALTAQLTEVFDRAIAGRGVAAALP